MVRNHDRQHWILHQIKHHHVLQLAVRTDGEDGAHEVMQGSGSSDIGDDDKENADCNIPNTRPQFGKYTLDWKIVAILTEL